HFSMPTFELVTRVPSGALKSVRVASNNFFPFGVRLGRFGGRTPELFWSFANASCTVSIMLVFGPTLSGRVFHTPDKSRGLNGTPGALTFLSSACACFSVRQWGQVFQPGGGSSVCAKALAVKTKPARRRMKTIMFLLNL